ncbi:MAG: YhcH/YjgK/YiaL family protein [Candidatus Omnitrophica bacterium]|nr:YhcH/YjgK/YiaL family protein [Candidatus Omnitrophota bacterium]
MIVDTIENWKAYRYGTAWNKAFQFLESLSPEVEDGEYPIQGKSIFARVDTYETRTPEQAGLEAHRAYVDIQAVLDGQEAMEWFPHEQVVTKIPYDPSKDAEFFIRRTPGPGRLIVTPGIFVVFFPQDAHMPSLIAGDAPESVKKVVVKIAKDILLPRD